jgi:SNF2 family DNA or RNA helicase
MPLDANQIVRGTPVRHLYQPARIGILTGQRMPAIVLMVEVKWSNQSEFVPASALELFDVTEDSSFESIVKNSRYERIESLRSLMTFEKLNGALSNVMYSMQTAEIRFFAHQFVPVLKFVNAPLGRLLIADEVGLGKTIEAGLIWTECRARFKARRLLVICPPTLVPKWIRELQDRFAIEAEFADAKQLLNRFTRFQQQGPSQSFALVSSYHALRPRKKEKLQIQPWLNFQGTEVRFEGNDSMEDWKPRPALLRSLLESDGVPFIDLVVFDEAHLMKNTATANHVVGDVLATSSQAALALSATPLTTKSRDLYALLKLIDPDMFRDESTFTDLCRRNRPAVLLASELSKPQIRREQCLQLLDSMPESAAQRNLRSRLIAISDAKTLDETEKVDLQGKAGRLNELGSFLTRTRKVEITEGKALREAVALDVDPTKQEIIFYNSVLRLIRQRVAERGDALSLFHLIGPALSMTSCLPVMAEKLKSGDSKWGDLDDLANLDNAFTEDEDDSDFVGENQSTLLGDLSWLPVYDFARADTKYNKLRDELLSRSPQEKVIIFAFFKGTLKYLQSRLEKDGLSCLLVTGDVKDTTKRDQLLQDFNSPGYRVLLCSEVAAEGVDLQFCRVMVNYDLPWNPMRVEQRIGRIDRIGQEAKTIVIINFHVRGTIDGSIYQHLHRKIGIFTETIGDLEGIIGDHVNQLTLQLLANELTPAQAEEKIRLAAEAIARERAVVAQIDEESETLLGLRSYLQDNVRQGRSLGRYIKPSELRLFTVEYFRDTYLGSDSCQLNWDTPAEGCLKLILSFRAFSDFESYLTQQVFGWPKGFDRANRTVTLTFDPVIHETHRRKHRSLILVNHLHSLVGWMNSTYLNRRKVWHPASSLRVTSDAVAADVYFYLVLRVSLKHPALAKEELLFRARSLSTGRTLPLHDSEALVNQAIDDGTSWVDAAGYPDCSLALDSVWKMLIRDCDDIQEAFHEELELRLNSKQAQLESHFQRRLETAYRRLETMRQSVGSREQGIRVTQNQIKHLRERLDEERAKIDRSASVAPEFKRVACGLIKTSRAS